VVAVTKAPWPSSRREVAHVVLVAWLVHGTYLGGVFIALSRGMSAGTAAMLVGLQPLVTVFLARVWIGERVDVRQWAGLALGLVGLWLVVRHRFSLDADPWAFVATGCALVGISVGTLWQKRHATHVDLRTGAVIQFAACAALYLPLVLLFEREASVRWTPQFLFAVGWSVLVLSVGAISLLYWLLRHGAAAGVASLFYLVPPVTALMAYFLFDERLDAIQIAGMAIIVVAVAMARPAVGATRL
jgi:drug/metabolite transporter (DMT)-like permease